MPGIPDKKTYKPDFPEADRSGRLTAKQRSFVRYFLESHEIANSAIKAGYSEKHANTIGNRLMHNSRIIGLITEEEEKAIEAAGINRKDALMRLAKMVYWDPRSLYQDDGSIKPPSEWDDATAAVIAGVEVMEVFGGQGGRKVSIGRTKKVKVVDPLRSLEVLLKVLGLQKDTVVYPGKDGNPMSPGVQIQNRIEVVFVNPPRPDTLNPGNEAGEGD